MTSGKRLRHRGDVGGDVESVGDDEQRDEPQHDPARRELQDVGGEPFAGETADASADKLDLAIMNGRVKNTVQSSP